MPNLTSSSAPLVHQSSSLLANRVPVRDSLWLLCLALSLLTLSSCRSVIHMEEAGAESSIDESGKIPTKAFFGNPLFSRPTLSPSGRRVATVISREEVDVLMALELSTKKMTPLAYLEREASATNASQAIEKIGWASEDVVVASASRPLIARGARARRTSLIVSDVRSPDPEFLGEDWDYTQQFEDRIISWLPDSPDRVLLDLGGLARQVDLKSGMLRKVDMQRRGLGGWQADHEFKVRIGYKGREWNNEFEIWGRVSDQDRLEQLVRWDPLDKNATGAGFHFAGFSDRPEIIYALSERETGRFVIREFDLRSKELGKIVYGHRVWRGRRSYLRLRWPVAFSALPGRSTHRSFHRPRAPPTLAARSSSFLRQDR